MSSLDIKRECRNILLLLADKVDADESEDGSLHKLLDFVLKVVEADRVSEFALQLVRAPEAGEVWLYPGVDGRWVASSMDYHPTMHVVHGGPRAAWNAFETDCIRDGGDPRKYQLVVGTMVAGYFFPLRDQRLDE